MMRTRFAPSPTGFMHIGGLRTALFGFLLARKMGGSFILRIEDTDQARFVGGAAEKIYEVLKMAGLSYDEGPDVGGDYGPYVQSQRKDIYLKHAQQLVEEGKAYYCKCTKEELEERPCRGAQCAPAPDDPHVIRQLIPPGTTTFTDKVFGDITVENAEIEDQVLI